MGPTGDVSRRSRLRRARLLRESGERNVALPGRPSPLPALDDSLTERAGGLSMLGPNAPVNPGPQPFAFFLLAGQSVLAGAQPSVGFAKDTGGRAAGPVGSAWYPL